MSCPPWLEQLRAELAPQPGEPLELLHRKRLLLGTVLQVSQVCCWSAMLMTRESSAWGPL
eukprot:scaffold323235_cov13-Tisochrysis_lutea.AAC.1